MVTTTTPHPQETERHGGSGGTCGFTLLRQLPPGPERERQRSRLVETWLPMAHRIAGRYRERGENLEDLCQVAALGLVKAVDRFDPEVSDAFESYAVPTIRGELKRHFRDNTWGVHVPRRVQELRNAVRTALQELAPRTAPRTPSVAELAESAKLGEEEVRRGLEALDSYRPVSLDGTPTPEGEHPLRDRLGADDPAYAIVVDRESVRPALAELPERERYILYLRFFHARTQRAIAAELGLSQMHVSRLITQACAQVKHRVEARPPRAALTGSGSA
ncbi:MULTISPECIES: SigB/SigF/SigG family RNA polymerase sigma factor [unclassified Streptomyces]|uniref:SigB/SigF/SigG family RNA polymerase sigma factor n=1 Tax=unclassified Streptomyces TaxID=2593676 RepID=UPI000BAC66BB|nr:SigB/SigF/SigG family RNA polymerase sigma factor [Streptomyces sp. CLI2509]ASY31531.1 B/F/G family RNA polymerase sigma-70 factor [Streptomyces sp. CLI2509]MYX18663.1 SigB/SigF/SigG family RNA polymerase sigma factor [Streptomyces sp. SID8380]